MTLNEESRYDGLNVVVSVTTERASVSVALFHTLVLSLHYLYSLQRASGGIYIKLCIGYLISSPRLSHARPDFDKI